jgi:hypothetical protein
VSARPLSKFFYPDSCPTHRVSTDEAKPEKADLSKQSENRHTLSPRGVATVAIYTLATFATQNWTHQALANATFVDIDHQQPIKEAGNLVVPASGEESLSKEATLAKRVKSEMPIASPESVVTKEFALEASQTSKTSITQPTPGTPIIVLPTVASSTPSASSTATTPPETKATLGRTSTQKDSSTSVKQSSTTQLASAATLAEVQSHSARDLQEVSKSDSSTKLLPSRNTSTVNPQETRQVVAQGVPTTNQPCLEVEDLKSQLRALENINKPEAFQASPALSIVIPTGFGVDNNTGFISATYQQRTRYTDISDGALGIGVGLGDARKAVGVELSYTLASFGRSRDFGSGGFNVKVHRQLANDFSVAAGWNGFLNLGGRNDFEKSVYGTATKIFRTRDDINSPFSRVAVTAGIGSGQFRSESAVANDSGGVNVFGNVAVRVAQPVSLIAEWSGQDLGVGVSVAPFKNIPLVITPAVRDIVGAGDGPRFVLGTGFAFKF